MRGQLVLICLVLAGLVAGAPAGFAQREAMPAGERPEACRAGDSSSYVAPLPDGLPILQSASDRAKAVFALPYALMAEDSRDRSSDRLVHYGYYRGIDSDDLFADISRASLALTRLTGFYATTFLHCSADALVIVYRSATTFDGRDWIAAFARQMLGGESSLALRFFEGVRERNPGYSIAIVGHSSGGALASYVADVVDLPSVTFNPIRTNAAVANNGRKQFNILGCRRCLRRPKRRLSTQYRRCLRTRALQSGTNVRHRTLAATEHRLSDPSIASDRCHSRRAGVAAGAEPGRDPLSQASFLWCPAADMAEG